MTVTAIHLSPCLSYFPRVALSSTYYVRRNSTKWRNLWFRRSAIFL